MSRRPRPAYANRTRSSLGLLALVAVILGAYAALYVYASAQPSSGWENTDPISNWHIPGSNHVTLPDTP